MKIKIVVLALLFISMVGLAYHIEISARPVKNVRVTPQTGDTHDH